MSCAVDCCKRALAMLRSVAVMDCCVKRSLAMRSLSVEASTALLALMYWRYAPRCAVSAFCTSRIKAFLLTSTWFFARSYWIFDCAVLYRFCMLLKMGTLSVKPMDSLRLSLNCWESDLTCVAWLKLGA